MERLTFAALSRMGSDSLTSTDAMPSQDPEKDQGQASAQPITSSFPFNNFPKELRLLIWEEALLQESSERIVLLTPAHFQIIPSKSLVSPMLTVNKESRYCALKFFDLKLPLFKLPDSATYNSELFCFDIVDIDTLIKDKKVVYISLEHDIFTSGLDLETIDDGIWSMVATTFLPQLTHIIIDAPICEPHFNCGISFIPATYRTRSIWNNRHRIKKVIAPCADGFEYPDDSPASCPCQKRQYSEVFARLFWNDDVFPGVQRYFMYPWGPITRYKMEDFLHHLFQRQPGDPLPTIYELRELVWAEWSMPIGGDDFHQNRAYFKVLTDPDIDEFRSCCCL
ncbi:hypothetical protein F4781DRAFT_444437 [Annulohypoxylon bovei var. microspora]|nr:hypothetical protein F4781DRAFT_444437 [Annulohypoxylon bovei var. microspora]